MGYILYEKRDHTAFITINRPEVMNAMNPQSWDELTMAFSDFAEDKNMWVAVLTGAGGKAFCTGADLKYKASGTQEKRLRRPVDDFIYVSEKCFKPVIAAVNGYAVGGGLELALRCDIIIASSNAVFGLPEVKRGLVADAGGIMSLPGRIPYHLAMEMILTGRFYTASEAYRFGLVNEVVDQDKLLEATESWAGNICECSPLAVQAAKQMVKSSYEMTSKLSQERVELLEGVKRLRTSEDYKEGPKAFAEKRKPVWKGI